jgi:hypothetical protein
MAVDPLLTQPTVVQTLALVQDIQARGFLAGVGRLILIVVVILVLIGVILGVLLARVVNRHRRGPR